MVPIVLSLNGTQQERKNSEAVKQVLYTRATEWSTSNSCMSACTLNFFRNQIVVNLWQLSDITADLTRCCILATLNNLLLETQWPTRTVHSGNLQETAVSVDAQKYHNKEQDYFHQVCRMRTYNVRLPFGFASLRHTKLWLPPDVFMEYVHKDHSIKSSILFLQNRSMQASIFSNGASKQDKLPNMCSVLC